MKTFPRLQVKVVVAGLIIAITAGYLVFTATSTSAVYYVTVGELLDQKDQAKDRVVRVSGWVLDGSIDKKDNLTLDFVLTDGKGTVPVGYKGVVPDLFGYSTNDLYQEVIVEGRYTSGGVLQARNLIVKHGPEFRAEPGAVSAKPTTG